MKYVLLTALFLLMHSQGLLAQKRRYIVFQAGVPKMYTHVYRSDPASHFSSNVKGRDKMIAFSYGWDFGNRLSLELGIRIRSNSVTTDKNATPFGVVDIYRYRARVIPVGLRYALPVFKNKLFLVPELYLSYVNTFMFNEEGCSEIQAQDVISRACIKPLRGVHKLTYELGSAVEIRRKKVAWAFSCRYANTFNNRPVVLETITYLKQGVPQLELNAKSGLKAVIFSLSFRKYLKASAK